MIALLVVLAALGLDRFLGEWPNRLHPVVWMGIAVKAAERRAPTAGRAAPFIYGLAMALILPAACGATAWATVSLPLVGPILAVLWLKSTFAVRALGVAGRGVSGPLATGDLHGAREGLRSLCSRDPRALGPDELAAGAVESLAENASDSVVAPLSWFVVGGLLGSGALAPAVAAAVAYRAVNTLDAMVGYHGRYEWLGKASARLDDLANLVPARLTAVLLLVGGAGSGASVRSGVTTMVRDRGNTESPNAGWPMAAMAGLLGVRLEKPGHYALGSGRAPTAADVEVAWIIVVRGLGVGGIVGGLALGWAGW
ncbi:MAG: adenosylcobinamide-phosphate synthase CbiB [Pseudomonadota bacterium]|nr:adenosylcobinamide-phosphate synthase CbiB [Pseudomonadota bacterium]